jgi:hypothetical protein
VARGTRRSPVFLLVGLLVLALAAGVGFVALRPAGPPGAGASADDGPRPYASYSDADLAALVDAYRSEVEGLETRYRASSAVADAPEAARGAHIAEHIEAFERAHARGDALRRQAGELSQQVAVLRELEREQQLRAREADRDLLASLRERLAALF